MMDIILIEFTCVPHIKSKGLACVQHDTFDSRRTAEVLLLSTTPFNQEDSVCEYSSEASWEENYFKGS